MIAVTSSGRLCVHLGPSSAPLLVSWSLEISVVIEVKSSAVGYFFGACAPLKLASSSFTRSCSNEAVNDASSARLRHPQSCPRPRPAVEWSSLWLRCSGDMFFCFTISCNRNFCTSTLGVVSWRALHHRDARLKSNGLRKNSAAIAVCCSLGFLLRLDRRHLLSPTQEGSPRTCAWGLNVELSGAAQTLTPLSLVTPC